ncbi:hypothetical protein CBR_g32083 [Chara braunii]|uniref:Methyltransferase domain-containing protein n=1 Tax=Chara braunii TaxID=69332 RepID=A0A388LGH7_CHABU|nr:hypothetical protein CBR_g32083 [Chara braunii]|eukprot:GBG81408.1 hypothetical protein CBR_g32083 [Chara braunii]
MDPLISSRLHSWTFAVLMGFAYTVFVWFVYDWFSASQVGEYKSQEPTSELPPPLTLHFPKDPSVFICIRKSPFPQPERDNHTSAYDDPGIADRIFADNVDRQRFLMQGDPRNPAGAAAALQPHVLETWEPLYHCPFEERVGPYGDGGKWMCRVRDYVDPGCVVYSFGSNGHVRWERDVARLTNCEIHIFDPTPEVVQYLQSTPTEADATSALDTVVCALNGTSLPRRTQFHPWALYEASSTLASQFLLKSVTAVTGGTLRWIVEHAGTAVPQIVKIDMRGSELFIDFRAEADLWKQVHMLLVEVNLSVLSNCFQTGFYIPAPLGPTPEWQFFSVWINSLYDLGFLMFHREMNLFAENGRVWEIGFVNKIMF